MKAIDAMKYCETHNCEECPVTVRNLEKRTDIEKQYIPCFYNLWEEYKECDDAKI